MGNDCFKNPLKEWLSQSARAILKNSTVQKTKNEFSSTLGFNLQASIENYGT
jgi:hypothetical protein